MAKPRYWLLKSEPEVFSIDDLQRKGRDDWDGVRNYQARNFMQEMKVGDLALFYHSRAEPPAVVGVCRVSRTAAPDLTAQDPKHKYFDPKATPENPIWMCVQVEYVEHLPRPVTLPELKSEPGLAQMELTRKGSRLSVQPVRPEEWETVMRLARQDGGAAPVAEASKAGKAAPKGGKAAVPAGPKGGKAAASAGPKGGKAAASAASKSGKAAAPAGPKGGKAAASAASRSGKATKTESQAAKARKAERSGKEAGLTGALKEIAGTLARDAAEMVSAFARAATRPKKGGASKAAEGAKKAEAPPKAGGAKKAAPTRGGAKKAEAPPKAGGAKQAAPATGSAKQAGPAKADSKKGAAQSKAGTSKKKADGSKQADSGSAKPPKPSGNSKPTGPVGKAKPTEKPSGDSRPPKPKPQGRKGRKPKK